MEKKREKQRKREKKREKQRKTEKKREKERKREKKREKERTSLGQLWDHSGSVLVGVYIQSFSGNF